MSGFWLGAAGLTILAVLLILLPWYWMRSSAQKDALTNTQIIKQRMLELEREVSEGLISKQDKELAVKELKLALVDETESDPLPNANSAQASAKPVLFLGLFVSLGLGAGLYYSSSEVGNIKHWQQVTEKSSELAKRIVIEADPTVTETDLQDFALAMRTKLIHTPDDPIGWLLLGRLHMSINRLDSALQAFEKALNLNPNHLGVLSSYSQAMVMTGQEEYLRKAMPLIRRSLALNPEDINAYGMLAVTATQLGDIQTAITSWQNLKEKLPPSDPMMAQVNDRISALQGNQNNNLQKDTQVNTLTQDVASTSVIIKVALDEKLTGKVPENAYLFVFAQDASGAVRMPAAVVKSRLSDLPLEVELSDANAMMPTYKLSQLTETRLVARISIDENVAQAAGELQGEIVVTMTPGEQTKQTIIIDKELL